MDLEDWEETLGEYHVDDFLANAHSDDAGMFIDTPGWPHFNTFASNPFSYFFGSSTQEHNPQPKMPTQSPQIHTFKPIIKDEEPDYLPLHPPDVPQHILDANLDILVETQPPREVRTRTPNEIRTFSVSCRVLGNWKELQATIMKVSLEYLSEPVPVSTV